MPDTLAELRTEFFARGFDYLNPTRADEFINWAYRVDIAEAEDWPWLEATLTGTAPLTISDLRTIESVIDTTNQRKLRPLDRRHITDTDYTLSTVGTPECYYVTAGTVVNVYPANTANSLSVRYWKVPTALTADSDQPLVPSRFRALIVDAAVRRAYEDTDEAEASEGARAFFELRIATMRDSLLVQQHDRADDFVVSTNSDDWGQY